MSEKITFGELVESIAEETNNSKQFTHDFIKDFVDVINGGLEDDGRVNIAGFGKFELRRMDEREGYNPQTEEKITIPAHNKIVFKPYKDLRELVNAPYAHLESELIEDETDTADEKSEDTDASDQDDFIPTAPPTSHQPEDEQEGETAEEDAPFDLDDNYDEEFTPSISDQKAEEEKESEETEATEKSPFELDDDSSEHEKDPSISDSKEDNEESNDEDIVEFNTDAESENKKEKESLDIDNFITSIEPSKSKDAEASDSQEDPFQDEINDLENKEKSTDESFVEDQDDRTFAQDFENETDDNETNKEDSFDFISSTDPSTGEEAVHEEVTETSEEETEQEFMEEESSDDQEENRDHKDPFAPDFEDKTEEEDNEEEETTQPPSFASQRQSRNRWSSMPILAAAAVVLLLVAAGAWYFTSSSNGNTTQMATSETTSTSDIVKQENNQPKPPADEPTKAQPQQSEKQNQSQPKKTSSAASNAKTTTQRSTDSANLEIQKGQTLWSIAEDKYGNPRLWPWIYGNNGSLENPDIIMAGSSLSVPLPSGPQNTLNYSDSLGVAKGFLSTYRWYKNNQLPIARDHLWAAKSYHDNIRNITDIKIDKADLAYANQAR